MVRLYGEMHPIPSDPVANISAFMLGLLAEIEAPKARRAQTIQNGYLKRGET